MPVPTGAVSFSSIQTEFGASNPISLSEYYRGGVNVPAGQATSATDGSAVATSGAIRVGTFRGLTKAAAFAYPDFTNFLVGSGGGGGGGVAVTIQPDGQVRYFTRRPSVTTFSNWITPISGTPGNSHWARVTIETVIGDGTAQAFGTGWFSLSVNRVFSVDASASGEYVEADFRVEIATDAGGTNIVKNHVVNYTADNY